MKKNQLLLLTILCAGMLVGCSDDDNTTSGNGAEEQEESYAKDNLPWPLTQYMDSIHYRPADNFFMYCNGIYWKGTEPGDYGIAGINETEMGYALEELMEANKDPLHAKLEELSGKPMTNDELYQFLKPFYDRIDGIKNYEDAFRVAGELKAMGSVSIFNIQSLPEIKDGFVASLTTGAPADYKSLYEPFLTGDHPDHVFLHEVAEPQDSEEDEDENDDNGYTEQANKMVYKYIWPVLDLSDEHYTEPFGFHTWLLTPINELKAFMKLLVFIDFAPAANAQGLAYAQKYLPIKNDIDTTAEWAEARTEPLIDYLDSRSLIERHITPQLKAEVKQMCEEMRQTFIARIHNLTWMSAPTQQKAISKIEHINFLIGGPNQWMVDSPDLSTCPNLPEAMCKLYLCQLAYIQNATSKRISDDYFHFCGNNIMPPLLEINCYYMTESNNIIIYPSYILPPYYSSDMHPAMKYGMLMATIGHELTHAVDNEGSKYNEKGIRQEWWTLQDRIDYEARQQQLIDLYNRLPVLEDHPDLHGDGKLTLDENIADLGGLEIAHDAFVAHCQQLGFRGKELDNMERKFYQAYANSFRAVYNLKYCTKMCTDRHSFNKERVNGVVMNNDRWYELYNVQWGDYLYLRPENRTHIW